MENSRRDWLVLLSLCAVGAYMGRMQTGAREKGNTDFVGGTIQTLVRPAANMFSGASRSLSDYSAAMFSGPEIVEKNRRLEQQRRVMDMYGATSARLQREIDGLRNLIQMPPLPGRQKVYADVVGYFPREDRITVSAGAAQGVKPGDAVVTGDGLVGVISTTSGAHSQVALISSARLTIGAIIDRNPPAAGLLRGLAPTELLIEIPDANSPFAIGDIVLTSGFGKLPRGIVIGRIFSVDNDPEFGRRVGHILPAVQIGAVREVVILR